MKCVTVLTGAVQMLPEKDGQKPDRPELLSKGRLKTLLVSSFVAFLVQVLLLFKLV